MFCYQCEQTSQGQGCQVVGVCGKDENTATLQDLLIHALKGVSQYAHRAGQLGAADPEIDAFVIESIFATLTNVNFDADSVAALVYQAAQIRDRARALYTAAAVKAGVAALPLSGPAAWQPAADFDHAKIAGDARLGGQADDDAQCFGALGLSSVNTPRSAQHA